MLSLHHINHKSSTVDGEHIALSRRKEKRTLFLFVCFWGRFTLCLFFLLQLQLCSAGSACYSKYHKLFDLDLPLDPGLLDAKLNKVRDSYGDSMIQYSKKALKI